MRALFALCCFVMTQTSLASSPGFSISHFDHEDLIEVAKLCDVAYGKTSPHTAALENLGWHIEELYSDTQYYYGIKATNGPLRVVSFKGTDDLGSVLSDCDAVRLSSREAFPDFSESVLHRGFYDYYQKLGAGAHFSKVDHDEFLVFSGHSLGGAMCSLAGLDLLTKQKKRPDLYPDQFCSILTLGAPAALGADLARELSVIPHLRIAFDNDPVTLVTRGDLRHSKLYCKPESEVCVFTHAGNLIKLYGTNLMNHGCTAYINNLIDLPRRDLYGIWGPWNEQKNALYYTCPYLGSGIGFNCTDAQLIANFRSFNLPQDIALCGAQRLALSWWSLDYPQPYSNQAWHPRRCADTLFYQIWRTENLGHLNWKGLSILLTLNTLHIKYCFLNESYRQNTLRYFHRLIMMYPEDLEELIQKASTLPLPPFFEDSPSPFFAKQIWLAEQKRQNSLMACWSLSIAWFMQPKNLLYDFLCAYKAYRETLSS
jgi:hypothetical protein